MVIWGKCTSNISYKYHQPKQFYKSLPRQCSGVVASIWYCPMPSPAVLNWLHSNESKISTIGKNMDEPHTQEWAKEARHSSVNTAQFYLYKLKNRKNYSYALRNGNSRWGWWVNDWKIVKRSFWNNASWSGGWLHVC